MSDHHWRDTPYKPLRKSNTSITTNHGEISTHKHMGTYTSSHYWAKTPRVQVLLKPHPQITKQYFFNQTKHGFPQKKAAMWNECTHLSMARVWIHLLEKTILLGEGLASLKGSLNNTQAKQGASSSFYTDLIWESARLHFTPPQPDPTLPRLAPPCPAPPRPAPWLPVWNALRLENRVDLLEGKLRDDAIVWNKYKK